MGVWIDYVVIGAIVVVGIILFYKALKEPLDLLFGWIGKGIGSIRDKISDSHGGGLYDEIRYG